LSFLLLENAFTSFATHRNRQRVARVVRLHAVRIMPTRIIEKWGLTFNGFTITPLKQRSTSWHRHRYRLPKTIFAVLRGMFDRVVGEIYRYHARSSQRRWKVAPPRRSTSLSLFCKKSVSCRSRTIFAVDRGKPAVLP